MFPYREPKSHHLHYRGMSNQQTTPIADYDSPWKEALARYLPDFLALFFPDIHAQIDWERGYTLLDKELQQVTRDANLGRRLADTLVQVWRRDGTDVWVLIHIEVQGTAERDFARRMFVYYYRLFDRYERPIMSVAVLADEQADWRPARFVQDLWGCAVELRYPVVKLTDWRTREDELATSTNPFAVVVRAHLVAQATVGAAEARGRAKIGLIRGLFGQGYARERVLDLLRLIDWLVALPEEEERLVERELERIEEEQRMAYVTSWERMGLVDGQRMTLLRMVRARFGTVPEGVERHINAADQDELDILVDRISTAASLAELPGESSDTE